MTPAATATSRAVFTPSRVEQLAQVAGEVVGLGAERPREHERAGVVDCEQRGIGVHDVDVAIGALGHLVRDAERLGEAPQLGVVVERDRVRAGHESLDVLRDDIAVVIGVDRDHHHVDPFGVVAPIFGDVVEGAPQIGKRRRTDVGAARVSEEHHEQAVGGRDEPERLAVAADVGRGEGVDHRRRITRQPDQLPVTTSARREQHHHPNRDPERLHEVASGVPRDWM